MTSIAYEYPERLTVGEDKKMPRPSESSAKLATHIEQEYRRVIREDPEAQLLYKQLLDDFSIGDRAKAVVINLYRRLTAFSPEERAEKDPEHEHECKEIRNRTEAKWNSKNPS